MSQPEGLEAIIVDRVDELRLERNLTWSQLAAACAGVGGEQMTSETLRKIISARTTRIRINTWLVFALALEVSPLALAMPAERRPDINLTPVLQVSAPAAYGWLVGIRPTPTSGPLTDHMRVEMRRELCRLVPWLRSQPTADSGIDPAAVAELVSALLNTERIIDRSPGGAPTQGEAILRDEWAKALRVCKIHDCPRRGKPYEDAADWWTHLCTEHPGSVRQHNIMERLTARVNPEREG